VGHGGAGSGRRGGEVDELGDVDRLAEDAVEHGDRDRVGQGDWAGQGVQSEEGVQGGHVALGESRHAVQNGADGRGEVNRKGDWPM
jgi:hypothetical protein